MCADDLVVCHNNVIVSLLIDHNLVLDLMDLLCDDGDMSMIQSCVIDLRNMFLNTMNWSNLDLCSQLLKEIMSECIKQVYSISLSGILLPLNVVTA